MFLKLKACFWLGCPYRGQDRIHLHLITVSFISPLDLLIAGSILIGGWHCHVAFPRGLVAPISQIISMKCPICSQLLSEARGLLTSMNADWILTNRACVGGTFFKECGAFQPDIHVSSQLPSNMPHPTPFLLQFEGHRDYFVVDASSCYVRIMLVAIIVTLWG